MITTEDKKRFVKECMGCVYMRNIAGSVLIECVNHDVDMTAPAPTGLIGLRYVYPFNFNPRWREKPCKKYNKMNVKNIFRERISRTIISYVINEINDTKGYEIADDVSDEEIKKIWSMIGRHLKESKQNNLKS